MQAKQYTLPYRQSQKSLKLPVSRNVFYLEPNRVPKRDPFDLIGDALAAPLRSSPLSEFLEGAGEVICLVNDGTRPTPTGLVLEGIQSLLENHNVWFMVATGAHRAPTEEEVRRIFGNTYERFKGRVLVHDARQSETVYMGTSSRGTEVYINKRAVEADRLLIIGSVEPHYFAGYTGGRKSLLPGVAGFQTIESNHKFALQAEAKGLALRGNPVHEDMVEGLSMFDRSKIFSIQAVLDRDHQLFGLACGDVYESFDACIPMAHEVYCVQVDCKADLVITAAPYPMDLDLYQSQKAIENGKLILKDGGILLLVSSCYDGIGPDTFFKLLSSCHSAAAVTEKIAQGYKLGYHKAAKLVELAGRCQIWGLTDLPAEQLKAVYLSAKDDLQSSVDEALSILGEDAVVAILPEGSITVPELRESSE